MSSSDKYLLYGYLTNHGKQIGVVVRFLLGAIQSSLRVQNPGQSQSEVRAKSVDDDGPTSVRVLQKLHSNQLVDGVENDLQDTDDQQLQAAHFSQDSAVGNEDCSGSKFRGDQTADKRKEV